jgi:uncharacterized membrane protein
VADIQLGLVVSPLVDAELAARLRDDVHAALAGRYDDVSWDVQLVHDHLVPPPAHVTELVDAARARLLADDWDLAVLVTEAPLRLRRRPLVTHASRTHGVALVSLPALGLVQRRRRLRDAVIEAVGTLLGAEPRRRLGELAEDLGEGAGEGVAFLARVVSGNIRLLIGMVAANHPWRLVAHLSRAMLGALAVAVFALVSLDVWRLAAALDAWRQAVLAILSIGAAAATLVVAHGLWERAADRRAREQVALFNVATVATVLFGLGTLYAAVFVSSLVVAGLLIDQSLFSDVVRHEAGVGDYARLAWLASTLATAGGALGAILETDQAVREAAYARVPGD